MILAIVVVRRSVAIVVLMIDLLIVINLCIIFMLKHYYVSPS